MLKTSRQLLFSLLCLLLCLFVRFVSAFHPSGRYCKFKDALCHSCNRKDHLSKVCGAPFRCQHQRRPQPAADSLGKKTTRLAHLVEDEGKGVVSSDNSELECYTICNMGTLKSSPIEVPIHVHSREVRMQVDTGAALTLI
ncbi:hypothetical protein E2C01_051605 [Portunus trituberculatus]|uniref:Peptidase A2 domain-containing protein n=1 Tax=Portunus trituberculatus TaxID=210409 RepID=A0A5B7GBG7_PORTR|nr:hypothetical protein [Portunus trituberculatus]